MYTALGPATLRSGEQVTAAVVAAPDLAWADRVERMLVHKGDPWNWQNSALLRQQTGVGARFFLLHRDGQPFSSLAIIEDQGVGLLCHVWTAESDRQVGASSILMEHALADFRRRGGRALYLGTEYEGTAWHYYRRRGFEPVAGRCGAMVQLPEPQEAFTARWFAAGETVVEPLAWRHWPAAFPLFLEPSGGLIRLAAGRLFGAKLAEEPLLPLLREQGQRAAVGELPCAYVLRAKDSAAVLGLAGRSEHPLWPRTEMVDLFCHETRWAAAGALLEPLLKQDHGTRLLAYVDPEQPQKQAALERAGFRVSAHWPRGLEVTQGGERVEVTLLERD